MSTRPQTYRCVRSACGGAPHVRGRPRLGIPPGSPAVWNRRVSPRPRRASDEQVCDYAALRAMNRLRPAESHPGRHRGGSGGDGGGAGAAVRVAAGSASQHDAAVRRWRWQLRRRDPEEAPLALGRIAGLCRVHFPTWPLRRRRSRGTPAYLQIDRRDRPGSLPESLADPGQGDPEAIEGLDRSGGRGGRAEKGDGCHVSGAAGGGGAQRVDDVAGLHRKGTAKQWMRQDLEGLLAPYPA